MSEPPPPEAPQAPPPSDSDFEPVGRDPRFVVRLVLLLLIGLSAATLIGIKLQHAAAGCGAGLIRPGSSVIPNDDAGR